MRTESVTVRPFFALPPTLESAFSLVGIRFSDDEEFQTDRAIKTGVHPHEAQTQLALPAAVREVLVQYGDLRLWELLVVLTDETRRRSKTLTRVNLAEFLFQSPVEVPTRNIRLSWMGRRGATLSSYVALASDQLHQPGKPFRAAQVATMKHFSVNKNGPGADFPVEFKSPEDFEKAGFPGNSTVVVCGDADSLTEEKPEDMALSIWINDRLRATFAYSRRQKRANVVQDTVRSLGVTQLMLLAKTLEDVSQDCVGYRFLKHVFEGANYKPEDLAQLTEVQRFALAQVFCGLTDSSSKVN